MLPFPAFPSPSRFFLRHPPSLSPIPPFFLISLPSFPLLSSFLLSLPPLSHFPSLPPLLYFPSLPPSFLPYLPFQTSTISFPYHQCPFLLIFIPFIPLIIGLLLLFLRKRGKK